MVDVTQGTMTTENTAPRFLGFDPESTVDVRQFDDRTWTILRPLTYHAKLEDFEVPAEGRTDFASVPRAFVWFLPRYGRYTKAAILHDYLWGVAVPVGRLTRLDADGIFRTAMRELGVPFLRRWIMWAAVRLASRLSGFAIGEFLVWLLVALPAFAFVAVPGLIILIWLAVFWLIEMVFFVILKPFSRKPVPRPRLRVRMS